MQSTLNSLDDTNAPSSALRPALLVLLLSLAIRLSWAGLATVTPISDFHGYEVLASRWLSTGEFGSPGWLAYRTPGYPAFLAGIYAVFGQNLTAAQLAQAVLGGISSALVVLLAARFFSSRAAALAGLLHAFSPTALAYVPVLASENVAVPLLLATLLALSNWPERSLRSLATAVAAGLCLGALILVRPAGVFFAPVCVVLSGWNPELRRISPARALLFTIACSLILAPWLVRNHARELGFPTVSTTGGVNLWMGNNPLAVTGDYVAGVQNLPKDMSEKEKADAYRAAAVDWVKGDPWRYLALCRVRCCRLIGTTPDGWAAKYIVPTKENDAATQAYFRELLGSAQPGELVRRGKRLEARQAKLLGRLRRISAPLGLLALVLCVARWRRFAPMAGPALCYAVGLSLTFFNERFRELWHPLMFILMAGLLSDLIWSTKELSARPSAAGKRVLAFAAVAATLLVHAVNIDRPLYRLPDPPPGTEAPTSAVAGSGDVASAPRGRRENVAAGPRAGREGDAPAEPAELTPRQTEPEGRLKIAAGASPLFRLADEFGASAGGD